MKNTKVKILTTIVVTLLATLLFCANTFAAIVINFPSNISNGKGTITVSGNTNNEKIYYQAVSMTENQYNTIGQLEDQIAAAYRSYKEEFDPKNEVYQPLKTKVNNGTATQAEYEQAQQLAQELETLTQNYETTKGSLEQRRNEAFPQYNNSGWLEAANGNFEVTNTTNHANYYTLWAKVGDVIDKIRIKVNGSSNVTPVLINWTLEVGKTLDLKGEGGTDLSSINWVSDDPTIATIADNKLKTLKVGETVIRGYNSGIEIADVNITVTSSSEQATRLDIPSDAKEYKGHKYYCFSGSKSWDDAKAYCEKIGGHLVTITTKGEADFVNTLDNTSKAWIGGYKDSAWKWVTGEAWNYTNWNNNEPANANRTALVSEKWSALDNNSMAVSGFICEWDVENEGELPIDPTEDPTEQTEPTDSTKPSTQEDSEKPSETKEPEEQLIYRQDGISNSTTSPKSTSGDTSIATKKIPQTGESIVAIVALVVVAGVSVVLFVNYRKNK